MRVVFLVILFVGILGCSSPRTESVSCISETQQSRPVLVLVDGEVNHPGWYSLLPEKGLGAAIEAAGGFTPWAAKKAVKVERVDGRVSTFDLRERRFQLEILQEGDRILVLRYMV